MILKSLSDKKEGRHKSLFDKEIWLLKRNGFLMAAAWTVLIIFSLVWNWQNEKQSVQALALNSLHKSYEKDILFRSWASMHGGVYVPVTDQTTPNPYLNYVGERDITTPSGRELTLMNPAYMTRQMYELGQGKYGVRGKLTSLNPLRPENSPSEWEAEALKSFEQGATHVFGTVDIDGERFMRLMKPFETEQGCLACHAHQGYQLGDIRGGIMVEAPMASYDAHLYGALNVLLAGHSAVWLTGLLLIGLLTSRVIVVRRFVESERKLKEEMERKVMVAEESVNFKQKFLANMSHEIRTPLSGILGITEALSRSSLTVQQEEYVRILNVSGESLKGVIDDVLDYSKIEAGKITLKKKVFSIVELFENVKSLFYNSRKKQVDFALLFDPALPEYIKADEHRIGQVLRNLVSNAIKFTEKGSITLQVSPVADSQPNGELLLKVAVKDTGTGIRKEKLRFLFQPFSQVGETDFREYEGTGLGLSISKEIVEMHQGTIGVESTPGVGSTFWFTFKAQVAEMPETYNASRKPMLKKNRNLNILLVEDNLINQKVFSVTLKYLGHNVTIARNGQEAVDVFLPGVFDLVLMDVQMPVMDGIKATNILKSKYAELPPIVGLSANAFEGDREKYMKLGMDEYLTKPLKAEELEALLEKLVID